MRDFLLTRCTEALYCEPWAILPEKLAVLVEALERRKGGVSLPEADLEEFRQANNEQRDKANLPEAAVRDVRGVRVQQVGRVAVMPMYGTVTQRPSFFTRYSGGVSAEQFTAAHAELIDDTSVGAVVWDVDSPGGSVAGVPEAADKLFAMKGKKPTVAVSNTLMASAAYWLASAADEIVATPSSLTGSIGVYTVHEDRSQANDRAGVKVSYVFAGKRKIDGNADAPLTDEARGAMQQMVDDYYGQFVAAVAKHRNTSEAAVRGGYGEGDTLTAKRAVAAGLADRVETMDSVVRRLGLRADGAAARAARQRHAVSLAV